MVEEENCLLWLEKDGTFNDEAFAGAAAADDEDSSNVEADLATMGEPREMMRRAAVIGADILVFFQVECLILKPFLYLFEWNFETESSSSVLMEPKAKECCKVCITNIINWYFVCVEAGKMQGCRDGASVG